ncbi:MAG: hypothetical protein R3F29_10435 [Planctomycetota bacterium]
MRGTGRRLLEVAVVVQQARRTRDLRLRIVAWPQMWIQRDVVQAAADLDQDQAELSNSST